MHPEAPRQTEDLLIDRSDDVIDITTHGLIQNEYSDIVQSVVKMDDLF